MEPGLSRSHPAPMAREHHSLTTVRHASASTPIDGVGSASVGAGPQTKGRVRPKLLALCWDRPAALRMGGQGRRSAATQREKAAAGVEKGAKEAKPKSYQSALALFCSNALLADAKKKSPKSTPLASAVKKRPTPTPLARGLIDGAKKRPKAPLAGAVFDGTKFTSAQAFAGPRHGCVFKLGQLGLGYYPDAPTAAGKRPKTPSASAALDGAAKKKLAPSPSTRVGPVQAFSELSISAASKRWAAPPPPAAPSP